jgi:hypothetical protein
MTALHVAALYQVDPVVQILVVVVAPTDQLAAAVLLL